MLQLHSRLLQFPPYIIPTKELFTGQWYPDHYLIFLIWSWFTTSTSRVVQWESLDNSRFIIYSIVSIDNRASSVTEIVLVVNSVI